MIQVGCIVVILLWLTICIPRITKQVNWKVWVSSVFVVYLLGNLYCTVLSRVPSNSRIVDLRLFKTYGDLFKVTTLHESEIVGFFSRFMNDTPVIVNLILNILLYYPLGYLLPLLFPKLKPKHIILIGCVCSIATEATQYLLKMGWCETDDVIHNTLGTAIGVWVWLWQSKRLNLHRSANPGKGET